jgi:hypothetical protein
MYKNFKYVNRFCGLNLVNLCIFIPNVVFVEGLPGQYG